jgi:ABC-2 type transport system permease protein
MSVAVGADAELTPPGREVKGPSATGGDPRRVLRLAFELARTDFKLRFFGSSLGYLWTLMRPLMLFGVLYFVFSVALKFDGDERFFPVALLLGMVLYQFLQEATNNAVRSLMVREHIVRKVDFPRLAVPLAGVMLASFNLTLNFIPVTVFLLASGGRPMESWLMMPLVLFYLLILALGPVMFLSALYVRYRDIEPIWDVIIAITFYITPIFFTLSTLRTQFGKEESRYFFLNPFAVAVQQARHSFIDPTHPSATQALGNPAWILFPFGLVGIVFVLGAWYFAKRAPSLAEEL